MRDHGDELFCELDEQVRRAGYGVTKLPLPLRSRVHVWIAIANQVGTERAHIIDERAPIGVPQSRTLCSREELALEPAH